MKTNELILKFEDKDCVYNFDDKINKIEDKKLVNILARENIKNSNSTLIIQSMNLGISDVIQFKINVSESGSFLFNFEKNKMDDQKREEILKNISKLHSDAEPTKETQIEKMKNLIKIISEYDQIYCSYVPRGNFQLTFEELSTALEDIDFAFPILYLISVDKGVFKKDGDKITFRKFSVDYLFTAVFAILESFEIFSGVFQIFNQESASAFLLVLAFFFFAVLTYSVYSIIYKNKKEVNKFLKYFLLIYGVVGVIVGVVAAYFVCKYAINIKVEDINTTAVLLITIGTSLVSLVGATFLSKLINLVIKKI